MATVTRTIGTNGRQYATITAWEADLDNAGVYASGDHAVGECYNDSIFNESFTINGGGTVGLASVTLTVADGERHDGTAGTGARIEGARTIRLSRANCVVSYLELNCLGTRVDQPIAMMGGNLAGQVMSHLILHDWNNGGGHHVGIGTGGFTIDGSVPPIVHNSVAYAGGTLFTSRTTSGIGSSSAASSYVRVYNCTSHNIRNDGGSGNLGRGIVILGGSAGGTTSEAKNNIATFCTDGDFVTSTGTVSHNASSDATASGTGSLTNIVTADQYVSTTGGSEDLHLKSGSDCIDAGTDLSATGIADIDIDIDGQQRPLGQAWDIGADEFPAGGLLLRRWREAMAC